MANPAVTFILIIVVGIAVGLLLYRYAGSNWLSQLTGTRRGQLTSALVGIAGAFVGYHLAILLGIASTGVSLIVATAGAALLVWVWRTIKV